jgi:tetratricopeptide (TPR) repeat protein
MTPDRLRQLSAFFLATSLTVAPALALAEDIDEVRPHGFTPSEQSSSMHFPRPNRREMQASSPEEAQKMANTMKTSLDAQHQKYSYKQDGFTHTIVVESTKKTVIFRAANPNAAKQELRKTQIIAELFPKNEPIASLLSRLYEDDKNWSKASEYFRKANTLCNNDTLDNTVTNLEINQAAREARLQSHYAYFELMMKHYETAIKMLTKSIELKPDYTTSYYNRAKAYRALHKNDLAEKDEKKLKELTQNESRNSQSVRPPADGAWALFMVEIYALEEALRIADATLLKEPNSATAILAQARANLRLGRYAKALASYKKLEPLVKDSASLKAEMATAAILTKQGPPPYGDLSAIASMPQVETSPPPSRGRHGHGHDQQRSLFAAPLAANKLAADHKGDYRVYAAICAGLKQKSQMKEMDSELNKMLLIVPNDTKVIEQKIETAEALRDWSGAEKYCNLYFAQLTQGKNSSIKTEFVQYAYGVRALARRAQKNFAGAIEDDTLVIKLAPESALAYRDRGDAYRQSGKYDLAVADYTKAIQLDNAQGSSNYWRRAKAYEKLNQAALAKQDSETAKKLDAAQSKI